MHAKQYRQRCGISEESQTWWNEYFIYLQDFASAPPAHVWPLSQLVDRAQCPVSIPSLSKTPVVVDESKLPSHLRALYEKVHGNHPQVHLFLVDSLLLRCTLIDLTWKQLFG